MGWAAGQARAVLGTVSGRFGGNGIVAAVAALDVDGPVIAATEGLPADARFEIGSVTKTMTATLLALLAGDGTLGLDDPVGRWLDAGRNADITLSELATHTAGLPRLAPNMRAWGRNPYRNFTGRRAERGLRAVTRKPGDGRLYSNFGYQLLGLVLTRAAGRSYQDLIAERLLEPLAMTCSGVGAAGGGTRITGHRESRPARHWDHALPGAGGVEATISDLARYLEACLTPPEGRLGDAIRMCQRPQVRIDASRAGGLGWSIRPGQGICLHNGGTAGFTASVALRPASRQAIGALVSAFGESSPLLDTAVLAALTDGAAPAAAS
jgi:serine-type D-Ala-D-Ala carboxypeptidase/endopeptidase